MLKNRSIAALIAALLATAYAVYLIVYFSGAVASTTGSEQVGAGIATALVTPHMILIAIGALFNWLGFFLRKAGFILVGAILYLVGGILFLAYILFIIPSAILAFIGYAKQKKLQA